MMSVTPQAAPGAQPAGKAVTSAMPQVDSAGLT